VLKDKGKLEDVFKAYDIRGLYAVQIDKDFTRKLALSLTYFFGLKQLKLATAYDVRESSRILYNILNEEFIREGHEVHALGLVPTPVFYNYIARHNMNGGVMVTASHNPPEWVGFKLCKENAEIIGEGNGMEFVKNKFFEEIKFVKVGEGKLVHANAEDDYLSFLNLNIRPPLSHKLCIDIGNGSTYSIVPKICNSYKMECMLVFPEPDGRFPNRSSEPTDESLVKLKEIVKTKSCPGAAFDGDGDRLVMVDEDGNVVRGDVLFALIAKGYEKNQNKKAIIEVNFSETIEKFLKDLGFEVFVSRVGHSFITKEMIEKNALIGGEISGHYYFKETFGADDSIYAFIKVLETLKKLNLSIKDFVKGLNLPPSSEVIALAVPDESKDLIMSKLKAYYENQSKRIITIDGIKAYFDDGWVLIRKSNTMPQIKIKAEGIGYKRLLDQAVKLVNEFSKS